MNASIIAVGTELLFGTTVNTNAAYISQKLQDLSINVMYHYTVGDNPERLKETLRLALKESDLIITTGGLGPTQDDLTKEVVCEVMEEELVCDNSLLEEMKIFFAKLGREMTENNVKQCFVPKGGTTFLNSKGTAPGFAIEKDEKIAIGLPGPPSEMKAMFENSVWPFLENKGDGVLYFKTIRTIGIGESALETEILDIIDNPENTTIATYAKLGECTLRVAAKMETEEAAKVAVDKTISRIKEKVGKYIYALDDTELKFVVAKKLVDRKISISSAESCTGGKFVADLVGYDGISTVLDRGIVTYSNKSKIEELGVKEDTLEKYGAVSSEVAMEMVEGLSNKTTSDLCVSVTGIAGPGGGTEEKPVGLVYIAVKYRGEEKVKELKLRNSGRESVRNQAVLQMLNLVNKTIEI